MAKILLVEDDTYLAATIEQWLSNEHHLIEIAYDGNTGWDRISLAEFDLLILDWNLPQISGVDLCKRFRANQGQTPIIMLTGRNSVSEKEQGLDSGADDYLTKPFNMKELAARVRALLRRPPALLNNVLQAGSLSLDPGKYRVTKGDKEVHLLPRDFALLEFFMRHQDQVFSANSLIQRVWQSDSEASSEALRTSVKRLRQKLDDNEDEGQSIIETIPRVGYRLRNLKT
jgi:DNA-binding response OmpR family regulator